MSSIAWPKELLLLAQEGFVLKNSIDHGVGHWARVRANGVRLAKMCRVNPMVPSLFGLFHDCRREDEYLDHGHGPRAAEFVEHLASQGKLDRYLAAREVSWLVQACAEHSDGLVHGPWPSRCVSMPTAWTWAGSGSSPIHSACALRPHASCSIAPTTGR